MPIRGQDTNLDLSTAELPLAALNNSTVDLTPPSVPQNLLAAGTGLTTASMTWDPSTDLGSGMKEYVVYRDAGEVNRVTHPTTTYNDSGLSPETTYTYTVSAVDNQDNESAESAGDTATTYQPAPVVTDAEVGNVADNIIVVTFDREVIATDYAQGWSFTENAAGVTVSSANKTLATEVQFTLSADISEGTTVAYNYNQGVGDYRNTDNVALASDSGSVTNNVSAGPAFDFHAYGADTDGKIKGLVVGDGAFQFARASTATITDWQGLVKDCLANELRIKNARRVENLIVDSEDFSVAGWTKTNGSISGNTFTASSANATLTDAYTAIAGDYVFSCKLKRVTGTGNIQIASDTGTWTTVTLTGSYQRFSVQQTLVAGAKSCGIRIVTSGDEVDIDEAQLELVEGQTNQNPSEYVSVGVLSGDYHGLGVDGVAAYAHENGNTVSSNVVTEAKGPDLTTDWGALYEPAATNLIQYSHELDNGWWFAYQTSITADDITAPDGTSSAEKITVTNGNNRGGVYKQFIAVSNSTEYTACVFAKEGTWDGLQISVHNNDSSQFRATFNLNTGAVHSTGTSATASIEPSIDGFYCCAVTVTTDSTSSDIRLWATSSSNFGTQGSLNSTVTSDGTKYIHLWGAQYEQGGENTSYIPTSGATATRTADDGAPSFDYSNWSQTEGSWIVDVMDIQDSIGDSLSIMSIRNAESGVMYLNDNNLVSNDGTSQSVRSISPAVAGDNVRMAVDFGTGSTIEVGTRLLPAGSFNWDGTPANYDGAYLTDNVINIFFTGPKPMVIRDFYGYKTRQGIPFIEANY